MTWRVQLFTLRCVATEVRSHGEFKCLSDFLTDENFK